MLDFGQNLVGWVTIKAKGNSGDIIIIKHAEVLDKQGNFYTENPRALPKQRQRISWMIQENLFEPHFTFFGFRYIKVGGVREEIKPENPHRQ